MGAGTGLDQGRGPGGAAEDTGRAARSAQVHGQGGAGPGSGVLYSARVSSVAWRLETRPCWSNN